MTYLAFAGSTYYPYGGAEDFVGRFNSIEEAKTGIKAHLQTKHSWDMEKDSIYCWWHITDENFQILISDEAI